MRNCFYSRSLLGNISRHCTKWKTLVAKLNDTFFTFSTQKSKTPENMLLYFTTPVDICFLIDLIVYYIYESKRNGLGRSRQDRQTERRTDGRTDGKTDRQTDRQTDICSDGQPYLTLDKTYFRCHNCGWHRPVISVPWANFGNRIAVFNYLYTSPVAGIHQHGNGELVGGVIRGSELAVTGIVAVSLINYDLK